MLVESLAIPDVKLITPKRFADSRGYFEQTYQRQQYHDAGIVADFVQDNHSRSVRGVLRGLHYQHRHPQAKLVSVSLGSVYDVAVDLRQGSPTFGRAVGAELSAYQVSQLFVQLFFAPGFFLLSYTLYFCDKCDDYSSPGDYYGLRLS
ncbi:dTDP-4-dehydrorhamnose 3,5-epimerase, partial [bacterium]|nr:dTDP-4-dehydrorhamnose 3,5-epimerase [bacterium]